MSLINNPYNQPDPADTPVAATCNHCEGEIYEGQPVYYAGHDPYCSVECALTFEGARRTTLERPSKCAVCTGVLYGASDEYEGDPVYEVDGVHLCGEECALDYAGVERKGSE